MIADQHQELSARAIRELIYERQYGVCLACHTGMHPDRFHAHHRKRRRDLPGVWCPCWTVALHPDCHVVAPQAVHQRPAWAIGRGLIVPSHADQRAVPIAHEWPYTGELLLACDGSLGWP